MKKFNKILLVEDQDIDAFLTEKVLLMAEVSDSISICKDGEEALTYIQDICRKKNANESIPELILLDINMPRMNGIEFLHELRRKYEKDFTVVILSSSENPQDVALSAKYNVDYYLVKPITEDKVKKMVERLFY
ncbi:response regulator [Rhodocytophaga rosea]|uniref:Response regulator n=1 Tax=Rhodocytophaga rosea TaxID=2704465 RepID=A0A6C0GRD7_9BACT|nr:response regulator [Rhodocytophaga rosea]QHT70163.1 response regulator [Rhodocytophaga rosea]